MDSSNPKTVDNKISGLIVSKSVRADVKLEVDEIKQCLGPFIKTLPRLDVIIVGERKDSITYVTNKTKACDEVGFLQQCHKISASVTQSELEQIVRDINADPEVTAILLQLPLPDHLNSSPVLELISPEKDADGLTTANFGLLFRDGVDAPIIPCTPHGCIHLLRHYGVNMSGAHAVVIGRSNLVGKPISLLLQSENATVTMCHSRTANLESIVRSADIVVAAVGRPNFVPGSWIQPGAVVIDVGINVVKDETKASGQRLVGDVEYTTAKENAKLITPVPGGVGPMTVAMLLRNTLSAFYLQRAREIIAHVKAMNTFELKDGNSEDKHSWKLTHIALESTLNQRIPIGVMSAVLKQLGLHAKNIENFDIVLAKLRA